MSTETTRRSRGRWSVEWVSLWVILALAFALSFRALYDVGQAAGLGSLSWALPVIVDGFAVLAATVIERLESKAARLYPWALLIGLVGVSAWWNGLHAGGTVTLDPLTAAIVAGSPPVVLGLAYHLLRMVTRAHERAEVKAERARERAQARAQAAAERAASKAQAPAQRAVSGEPVSSNGARPPAQGEPVSGEPTRAGEPAEAARAVEPPTGPPPGGWEAAARDVWARERAEGRTPTGAELTRLIGCSPATGKRLASKLRAEPPRLAVVAGERS